jgi:hypothetical protein
MTFSVSNFPSFSNVMSTLDPQGKMARIVNVLSRKKPILDFLPWAEGNLTTGHLVTAANALPSASWRQANAGIDPTIADTEQFTESCGLLEDESVIDEMIAELNGGAAYRAAQDDLKVEAFGQQLATALIYESVSSNPERIHGLTPRYPATTGYVNSGYVLAGTNAGVNCRSIWLLTPKLGKLYGIYTKGTKAGLERIDKGLERVYDASDKRLYAWVTQFKWRCGLVVEDYRYCVRFQWDPDDPAMDDSEKTMFLRMDDMLETIQEVEDGSIFIMDRTSKKKLKAQLASNTSRPQLDVVEKNGRRMEAFGGVPILTEESLVAETAIS